MARQPTDGGGRPATSGAGRLLALLPAGAFAALAAVVAAGLTAPLDVAVMEWVADRGTPALDRWASAATDLGAWIVVATTALVLSAFLWAGEERRAVALLWAGLVGATLLNHALKAAFVRERPDLCAWRIPHAGGWAFPSGHALNASVAYTLFAWLVGRMGASRVLRAFARGAAGALIVLVAATRVYLGVHFPSDVVGGILAGLAWALFCLSVLGGRRTGRNA